MTNRIDEHIPMRATELQILLVLLDGSRHGYGIVAALREESDGAIALEPGNLYRVLHRLLAAGLVKETDGEADDEAERRRYYGVTPLGRRVAAAELERLERLVELARAKRLRPSESA